MSNKPLILTDNLYDNVVLHPGFVVQNFSGTADDAPGHEPFHVADNLRDMTSWTTVGTNGTRDLYVDCLSVQSPNTVVLDRGHNFKGQAFNVYGCDDSTLSVGVVQYASCTVPSTPGGLPSDANGCLTPDGVWWKTFSTAAKRVWLIQSIGMGVGIAPIVTGLHLGVSYRFSEFMDAPGAYDYGTQVKYQRNELSRGAVRVKSRPMNFDKVAFAVSVESTDYAPFDAEIRRMLRYNAPCWFAFDDSDTTGVGQMRMFQLPGDLLYDPKVNPVHREIRGEFEEVVPTLYV
ncbi:MAG: hypothetical protein ACJ8AK_03005 [Gemmatimonadaceae bacterium]